ncbi:hypothetical protein QC762_601993 [Podospora pseudocomata]|uniref:Uncharacterized protein n=1 Tax=Podospora pseudocomata TaxID=2093779 RepID=A0ABR0G7B0_9PEZI|nr:hypothetical protein QC762_601993 [Podospora pseudocomata]
MLQQLFKDLIKLSFSLGSTRNVEMGYLDPPRDINTRTIDEVLVTGDIAGASGCRGQGGCGELAKGSTRKTATATGTKRSANRGTFPISTLTVERTGGASHRRMLRSPAINALSPYNWSVDRTMAGTAR